MAKGKGSIRKTAAGLTNITKLISTISKEAEKDKDLKAAKKALKRYALRKGIGAAGKRAGTAAVDLAPLPGPLKWAAKKGVGAAGNSKAASYATSKATSLAFRAVGAA